MKRINLFGVMKGRWWKRMIRLMDKYKEYERRMI
jgi:hypothetical protein